MYMIILVGIFKTNKFNLSLFELILKMFKSISAGFSEMQNAIRIHRCEKNRYYRSVLVG